MIRAVPALLRIAALVTIVVSAIVVPLVATAETPIPPAPTQWVTDKAGFLSAQTVSDLNAKLGAYDHDSGHQVLVYVAPTTGGVPIEDWAVRAFAQWKVGRKGLDDGLVLFIFPQDHALRFEVGYGLEPTVTDVAAARIIRDTITPAFKAGHPDQGVTDGVNQILALTGAAAATPADAQTANSSDLTTTQTVLIWIVIILVVVIFIIIAIRNPSLAASIVVNVISSRGSGTGSGEGGFSGGGGRSGGGGASGRW